MLLGFGGGSQTNEERDRRIKYTVKDDRERASFKKEVVSSRIKCWEVVEDVAVRGHQRLLSEQAHLERCCEGSCHINVNISAMQEAV